MTNEDWGLLESIYAFEIGCVDSGIRDRQRQRQLEEKMDAASEDEVRLSLSRWIRENLLSEESLSQRYGWEDVLRFLQWIDSGDYRV